MVRSITNTYGVGIRGRDQVLARLDKVKRAHGDAFVLRRPHRLIT